MQLTNRPQLDVTKLSTEANSISQQLIAQAASYQQRCLVLLDPFLSPIQDNIIDYFTDLNQLYQIKIMHPSILANRRPLLLELDLSDTFQQQALTYIVDNALRQSSADYLAYGYGQQYCAWLFTHSSASQIADDFAKLTLQKRLNKTLLLRFYDPAIFLQLISLLTTQQQKKLYGQIEHWALLSLDRKLHIKANLGSLTPVLSGQLGLSEDQLTRLYCIGINNQVIQTMRINDPAISIDSTLILGKVTPCLMRMLTKNIHDEVLLVEWAALAVKFGANFDLLPLVIKNTSNFKTRYQYYHWLDLMRSKDWEIITCINVANKKDIVGECDD